MIQIGSGRSWVAMDWHFVGEDLYVSIIGGETLISVPPPWHTGNPVVWMSTRSLFPATVRKH